MEICVREHRTVLNRNELRWRAVSCAGEQGFVLQSRDLLEQRVNGDSSVKEE